MVITLGQQYNIGEKSTGILYTVHFKLIAMQEHQTKKKDNSIISGRNPPSYCTLTLIAMQGHQQKGRQTNTSSKNKDESNTIIETSTAEDHDDENSNLKQKSPSKNQNKYDEGFILAFKFPAVTQFADILTGQQRRIFN